MHTGSFVFMPLKHNSCVRMKTGKSFHCPQAFCMDQLGVFIPSECREQKKVGEVTTRPAVGIIGLHKAEKPCLPLSVHHCTHRQAFQIPESIKKLATTKKVAKNASTQLSIPPHLWYIPPKLSSPNNTSGTLSSNLTFSHF